MMRLHSQNCILAASALLAFAPPAFAGTGSNGDTVELEEESVEPLSLENWVPLSSAPVSSAPLPEPLPLQGYRSNLYLRINGGLVTTTDSDGPGEEIDFDEGLLVAIAVGKRFPGDLNNFAFDLELEGVYTDQDADDEGLLQAVNDITTISAFFNGILDYRLAERFSVYGGGGLGLAWVDVGTTSDALNDFDDEDGPFLAWQAKAGFKYHTRGGAINLGYRFFNIDDVEIDDDVGDADFDLETEQHVLELGYTFGSAAF